jgi:hypothetical protein
MTIDEAVKHLEQRIDEYSSVPYEGYMSPVDERAIRIVLDELKALQECESCRCGGGNK